MRVYKIENIARGDAFYSVAISGTSKHVVKLNCVTMRGTLKTFRTINIPKKVAGKLKVGQRMYVIQDKFYDSDDYIYLYRGGMVFNYKTVTNNKYACEQYIKNLPGLFDNFKLDRAICKLALMRECVRRDIMPSLVAWRNLRKVFLSDAYAPLMRE